LFLWQCFLPQKQSMGSIGYIVSMVLGKEKMKQSLCSVVDSAAVVAMPCSSSKAMSGVTASCTDGVGHRHPKATVRCTKI